MMVDKEPYTELLVPDFKDLIIEGLTDIVSIMKKRVYDASAWTDDGVKVYLGGSLIETKSFKDYVNMYLGAPEEYPKFMKK